MAQETVSFYFGLGSRYSYLAATHESVLVRAVNDGVFGVPSFVFGGKMFWGNDRLPLVEHALSQAAGSH